MNIKFGEETIESKEIFNGKVIRVRVDKVKLPDGKESYREIVEHGGAVAMIPVDEKGNIYLVRQYRKPIEKVLLEIPAGRLEQGESTEDCARRELAEEIGLLPAHLVKLSNFYSSPGFSNEALTIFLAKNLKENKIAPVEGEFVEVEILSLSEALFKITSGEIQDGKTIAGLLLAHYYLQKE